MRKKILCIDDIPQERIGDLSLEDTLRTMFMGKYDLIFETNPKQAYELVKKDQTIGLVFLDIDFNGVPLGPEIADVLRSIRPDLKVIVLTSINRHGEKIRFGKKINVGKYVTKKELREDLIKIRVANLAEAFIEDPFNVNWTIGIDDENETITLENTKKAFKKTFNMPSKARQKAIALLYSCAAKPNVCIKSIEMDGFIDIANNSTDRYVNEVVYETNATVREATEWMTWGILDSLSCGTNEVKLVVGGVSSAVQSEAVASCNNDKAYRELKKKTDELEHRLKKIEALLKIQEV